MKSLIQFIRRIVNYRRLIFSMALQEIRKRYAGTFAGFMWTIVNPLMTVLVFWFIFSLGFKMNAVDGVPFVALFFCGFIPWLTFSESLMANTGCITRNVHLVKKILFPTEILVIINLVASLISHLVLVVVLLIVLHFNGIPLSIYNLQFIYYLTALMVFSVGLGWLFSSLNVFFRDIEQILGVLINIWFWMTPIVWFIEMIPERYQFIIKMNPMFYIVEGYRFAFIYHQPIWEVYRWAGYFWLVSIFIFILGGLVFRKLKLEFADVL